MPEQRRARLPLEPACPSSPSATFGRRPNSMPLLKARGVNLSESQVYRLVTGTSGTHPVAERSRLCATSWTAPPNDLFEPYVEMRAAATANAPKRSEDIGIKPGDPIARTPHSARANRRG